MYKSKAGPLAFLYDLSALTVYDVLFLTSSLSGITDELKLLVQCYVNLVFSLNLLLLRYTNPVSTKLNSMLYRCADKEENKLQRQKILMFIYPIYNHNWRNISTIYIYNKTSTKRNILTIKQNKSGSRSG